MTALDLGLRATTGILFVLASAVPAHSGERSDYLYGGTRVCNDAVLTSGRALNAAYGDHKQSSIAAEREARVLDRCRVKSTDPGATYEYAVAPADLYADAAYEASLAAEPTRAHRLAGIARERYAEAMRRADTDGHVQYIRHQLSLP